MKHLRTLSLLLSALLLAACGSSAADAEKAQGSPSRASDTVTPNSPEGLHIGAPDRIQNLFSQDTVECRFDSVRDLETYLFTGSTQASDYGKLPAFDTFPQINGYKTNEYARVGYVSIEKIFGIRPDTVDSFDSVTFQISADCIAYHYYFDANCISVIFSPGCFENRSTSDYYSAYAKYSSTSYSPVPYVGTLENVDGSVLRKSDEKEVVYICKNGIPRKVGMLLGDYFLSVTTAASGDTGKARAEYLQWMHSEDFAPLADLFSTDSTVFDAAMQKAEKIGAK